MSKPFMIGGKAYGITHTGCFMRPVSLRTSALLLTLIMVLMPMTPFADQNFDSSDSNPETNETLNEEKQIRKKNKNKNNR